MVLAALIVLLALALAAVGVQLALPRIAASRVREKLTAGGGTAEVRIAALPATRLLRSSGDRLIVRGSGLEIGLAGGGERSRPGGLAELDGFAAVDIELLDFRTGPFSIAAFVLERRDGGSYAMATQGTVAPAALAALGDGLLRGFPGAPLLGTVAAGLPALPLGSREVTVSVQVELISEAGRLRVGSGGGTIAGYPAGPVASVITAAVARRLEIAP